jgi:hypothetical protein
MAPKLRASPVRAVNTDHNVTTPASTIRGPYRSASVPAGVWKSA